MTLTPPPPRFCDSYRGSMLLVLVGLVLSSISYS
jgi:hypothetical protein